MPDLAAERAVLGRALADADSIAQLRPLVEITDFVPQHRPLWAGILYLADNGKPTIPVELCAHLKASGVECRGPRLLYIEELPEKCPTLGIALECAREIHAQAGRERDPLHEPMPLSDAYEEAAQCPPAFPFATGAAIMSMPAGNPLWLVNGLIPESGVCVISGEPKSTKTWIAVELGMALATATPAFGEYQAQRARHVAYFFAEDSVRSVQARLTALADSRHMDPLVASANLHIICRGRLDLMDEDQHSELVAACKTIPDLGLLILDPLRDIHYGEENDSKWMSRVMDALRRLRDELGCSILFIHHSHKGNKDTEGRRPGQKMRGSSAIHGAIDAGIYLSNTQTDMQSWWSNTVQVEIKEGAGAGKLELTLHLDNDAEGRAQGGSWSIDKGDVAASKTSTEVEDAILKALAASPGPLTVTAIKALVRKRPGPIFDALKRLEQSKRVVYSGTKHAKGGGYALTSNPC